VPWQLGVSENPNTHINTYYTLIAIAIPSPPRKAALIRHSTRCELCLFFSHYPEKGEKLKSSKNPTTPHCAFLFICVYGGATAFGFGYFGFWFFFYSSPILFASDAFLMDARLQFYWFKLSDWLAANLTLLMVGRNYYGTKIIRHSSSLAKSGRELAKSGRVNSPLSTRDKFGGFVCFAHPKPKSRPYHTIPCTISHLWAFFCEGLGLLVLGTPGKPTIRKRHNLTT